MARTIKASRLPNTRRLLDGTLTPQEFVAANTFGFTTRCNGCGGLPVVEAMVFVPYKEAVSRGMVPEGHEASREVIDATVMLRSGANGAQEPHVRLSKAYSCRLCQPAFERQLARAPSWAIVDINRGPNPTNQILVGV